MLVALLGCARHATPRESELSYESLAGGGLAVLGVWHGTADEESSVSDRLAALAWSSVLRQWPDLDVLPPFSVARHLGPDRYPAVVRGLAEASSPDPDDVREVARALGGRRYLLVARVEQDEVRRAADRGAATVVCDGDAGDRERYSAERSVAVRVLIRDVDAGRVVWSRNATRAAAVSNLRLKACDPLWVDLLELLLSEEEARPGFPAPPNRWQIFEEVFAELSRTLPVRSR